MRTIKFRAWDKRNKRMVNCMEWSGPFDDGWPFKDDDYIFMQFTGLKDKNGKEIYEGDIVRIFDTLYGPMEEKYSVKWHTEKAAFLVNEKLMDYYRDHIPLEVIGNIYENLELLNV